MADECLQLRGAGSSIIDDGEARSNGSVIVHAGHAGYCLKWWHDLDVATCRGCTCT